MITMNQVFSITLRASDGRERTDLWWLPNAACRNDLYDKAAKRGLQITNKSQII